MDESNYYGAPSDAEKTVNIRERLRQYYDPEDFVTVINADTKPVRYQFASPTSIETLSSGPGDKNTIMHRPPQVVVLQPGETKLCPAYEADMMIENTIKQIAMASLEQRVESGLIDKNRATFDWTDPNFQRKWIDKIFLGKEDIIGKYNKSIVPQSVEEDLDINVATEPKQTRRSKE